MNEDWRRLTKDLITLGYTVSRVVASVVASNSPEGHLPMDNVSRSSIFKFILFWFY